MQRYTLVAVGVFAAVVIGGCAGEEIVAPVDSPVTVERSQFFLTVTNVGVLPLSNLTIGIKPGGVRPEYQTSIRRLASGQDIDIPFADFRGVDRNALNLQSVSPRSIHITASDLEGTEHDVEFPWE